MSSRAARTLRPQRAPAFEIDLVARSGAEYGPSLRRELSRASHLFKTRLTHASFALVGDRRMSGLHERFMRIQGPTDVLTFELEHDQRGSVTSGEIVLCVPEARRQARRQGTTVANELLLYAIHGLLHLSGYDDLTEAGYRAMHREEDRILIALGVGRVFSPERRSERSTRRSKKDGRVR